MKRKHGHALCAASARQTKTLVSFKTCKSKPAHCRTCRPRSGERQRSLQRSTISGEVWSRAAAQPQAGSSPSASTDACSTGPSTAGANDAGETTTDCPVGNAMLTAAQSDGGQGGSARPAHVEEGNRHRSHRSIQSRQSLHVTN